MKRDTLVLAGAIVVGISEAATIHFVGWNILSWLILPSCLIAVLAATDKRSHPLLMVAILVVAIVAFIVSLIWWFAVCYPNPAPINFN